MDSPTLSPESTVAEALLTAETVRRVFAATKTACAGCCFARFCSLREVAATYGLALEDFLRQLERAAHAATPTYQRSIE